jgi:hypothetical protein
MVSLLTISAAKGLTSDQKIDRKINCGNFASIDSEGKLGMNGETHILRISR